MNIAYFDCFAGASGDMILGALMDAGLELETLKAELSKLHLSHYDLKVQKIVKRGMGGSKALVHIDDDHHHHHHRHLHHIEGIIAGSDLTDAVKEQSRAIFRRLAEAEAHVHRTTVDKIHFHEVGAMDAIIDVVGAVAGLAALGIEKIYCSPLHLGTGTVTCAHGTLPVPAPATLELVKGRPVYASSVQGELLTPTGAAILTTLCDDFGPMPAMTVAKVGYGAGAADPEIPNLLRIAIGSSDAESRGYDTEQALVIETNIDDMNPQYYDYLMQQILALGAMDVFLTNVQMKKNRPGTLLTITCDRAMLGSFTDFLMRETTSIGLRWRVEDRIKARRMMREVRIPYGVVRVKVAHAGNGALNITPEYEDCKQLALENQVPLKTIMEQAKAAVVTTGEKTYWEATPNL